MTDQPITGALIVERQISPADADELRSRFESLHGGHIVVLGPNVRYVPVEKLGDPEVIELAPKLLTPAFWLAIVALLLSLIALSINAYILF